jgi:gluconolactonase
MQAILEGNLSRIVESPELTIIASGFRGTEGPVWHPAGYLTFVDLEGNQLLRWSPADGLQVLRGPNAHGNGCTLDERGRLVMCEGDSHSVVRLEADGNWTTLAQSWQGKRLNRPNDIIRRSDGTYFFTDPNLFVPHAERQLGSSAVWRLAPDGRLDMVAVDLAFPNGLALSPDEKTLYVANSFLDERCMEERKQHAVCHHRYLAAYDVAADGSLSNFRQVTDLASDAHDCPDGLKVDRNGIVFCTGSGATWVLDAGGRVLGKIRTPEPGRNCAFGDADMKTLYITALTTVYSLRMKTPGIAGTGVLPVSPALPPR